MKKNNLIFKALILIFSIQLGAGTVNKSPADPREYNTFFLKNGIEVITVSDPELATSAATLSVGVGAFQDPEGAQGIAHFLEHMIFMGSKKYKSPNEYMEFISQNGGSTNAFTAAEQTTYLFSINSKQFAPALDRLSSAIKAPLFDGTMVEKEINAVNSEWLKSRQTDGFIQQRTLALTGNPSHPRVKLGVGNKDTLGTNEKQLLGSLRDFHSKYYSANLMKLVLVGNQSSKELAKLAKKYFSKIVNKNVERPLTNIPAYRAEDLSKEIFIRSKVKSPIFIVEFPIENNRDSWKSKPNQYISKLINSQEDGSLMVKLQDEGLIQSGTGIFMPTAWGKDGSAFIEYSLTEKGERNTDKILSLTYQYIELIKSNGIDKAYFDELASINKIRFEDYQSPSALGLAVGFGQRVFDWPAENLIDFRYVTSDFDPDAITSTLSQLTPERSRIYHIGPDESSDIDLQYADGAYRVESLSAERLASLVNLDIALSLPQPEVIEVEQEFKTARSDNFIKPKKIFEDEGVQAFLSSSQDHQGKDGIMGLVFRTPATSKNVNNLVSANLLVAAFQKKNLRIIQRAAQRGAFVIPAIDGVGNPVISMSGRTKRHIQYANDLIDKFLVFEITERSLKDLKKQYADSYESISELAVADQLEYHALTITKQAPYLYSQKQFLNALESVTLEDVNRIQKEILESSFIDLYAHGNYNSDQIIEFTKSVRNKIGATSQITPWLYENEFEVKVGRGLVKKLRMPKDGVGIIDSYIYPEKSLKTEAQFMIINKIFRTSFFNDLRTNQQVGYIVTSYNESIHDFPTLSMMVVSDNTDLQALKEKIVDFQYGFAAAFEQIDKKTVQGLQRALLEEMIKKPENIAVEAASYFSDWGDGNYSFDTADKIAVHIEDATKGDLVELTNKIFFDGVFMNSTIQLKGDDFKDSSYFSWQNVSKQ